MPALHKMKNIVLIGMPGVGKSTVGVVVAKRMGCRFVDADLVIQETYGKLLHELIEEHGVDGFLELENRVNASLNVENTVIATGGSVCYGREAMAHLKQIGIVVYLKLGCEALTERLGDLNERGVALKAGQTLETLYLERVPLYEAYADITVDCEGKSLRETAEEVCRCVRLFRETDGKRVSETAESHSLPSE